MPFAQELQLLSEIPRLRVLILSYHTHISWGSPLSLRSREEYFPTLFTRCKALEYIDVRRTPIYRRWFRDGRPHRDISVEEVFLPDWNIS